MQRQESATKQVNQAVGRKRRGAGSVVRAGVLIVVLATVVPAVEGAEASSVEDGGGRGVGEWPVSFEIINKNESATEQSCAGDGHDYTVRGSLVGPPGVRAGDVEAVTLYVPGSGDASTWHFTAVPGVDHVTEMARQGHASVFLHPLGYGPSDPVHGNDVCFGTYATHVKQVIEQLREGSYSIDGSAPAFKRVALAGHSGGGFIAELTQVSFAAADALIVAGWTDYGLGFDDDLDPLYPAYDAAVRFSERCATAPERKWGTHGESGWAYLFDPEGLEQLVYDIEDDVLEALAGLYERDACGGSDDLSLAIAANIALASQVGVPVLVGSGEFDPVAPPAAVELQHARYAVDNDADVTSFKIPESGHQVMMNNSAPTFRSILHLWLEKRGF